MKLLIFEKVVEILKLVKDSNFNFEEFFLDVKDDDGKLMIGVKEKFNIVF